MQSIKPFEKLVLTVFGVLILHIASAQENYLPGYLITLQEDTLKGFIDYRNWDKNPDKIYFKDIDNKPLEYTPTTIKAFFVKDEIYRSATVEIETSPTVMHNLDSNPELRIQVNTVFLQAMILGEKSLYSFKNKNGEYFYIQHEGELELLGYKKYIKLEEGNRVLKENRKYLVQLSQYLSDCPTVQTKFSNLKYEKKYLEKLFLFYYSCIDSGVEFQKEVEKTSLETGFLAGINSTSIKFHSESFPDLVQTDYPLSINFSGGIFLDIIFPRNQRKWSIYNELFFNSYDIEGSYMDFKSENDFTITTTELEYSYINLTNAIRYKYPIQTYFLYLNLGMSNGFALSEKNYKKEEIKFYTSERIVEGKALNRTRKYEQSLFLSTGAKLKSYSFEIRYALGNGISDIDAALNSTTHRFYLLCGYTL